jgi:hypothetical protein
MNHQSFDHTKVKQSSESNQSINYASSDKFVRCTLVVEAVLKGADQ